MDSGPGPNGLTRALIASLVDPFLLARLVRDEAGAVIDLEGVAANDALAKLLAMPVETLQGMRFGALAPSDYVSLLLTRIAEVDEARKPISMREQAHLVGADIKQERWLDADISPVLPDLVSVSLRDVTERVLRQRERAAAERRYRLLTEQMHDVVWTMDIETLRFTYVSPSVEALRGFTPQEVMAQPMDAALTPQGSAALRARITRMVSEIQAGTRSMDEISIEEVEQPRRDGTTVWTEVVGQYFLDEETGHIAYRAVTRDISARRAATKALEQSERRFRLALRSAPVGMAVVDLGRGFLEVNPALARMLQRDVEWFAGKGIHDIVDPADDEADIGMRAIMIRGDEESLTRRKHLVAADGTLLLVEHSLGLLRDEAGQPLSFVSQFVDITEKDRVQQMLQFLAAHDPLTGVPNRREFNSRLAPMLERRGRGGEDLALLFMDVDNLKQLNDERGHAAGDEILVQLSRRMSSLLRSEDLLARVGGDEFVVVLLGVATPEQVESVAGKIKERAAEPIRLDGHDLRTTLSFGAAIAQEGEQIEELLKRADAALYRAKQGGRDRLSW